jgi:hypothetical protein
MPAFATAREARRTLLAERDGALAHLRAIARDGEHGFTFELTPESLVPLERWYFALRASRGWARAGTDRASFERAMAVYFGAVAKRRVAGARWVVEPSPFAAGHFELGVGVPLTCVMVSGMCDDWFKAPRNARQDALRRLYEDCWGAPRRAKPKAGNGTGGAKAAVAKEVAVDDATIAREIERLLARKSTPLLLEGTLVTFVRHGLQDDRVKVGRIHAVLLALEKKGVVLAVPMARKKASRYRLRGRGDGLDPSANRGA